MHRHVHTHTRTHAQTQAFKWWLFSPIYFTKATSNPNWKQFREYFYCVESSHNVNEPKSVCLIHSKANHWDIRLAARKGFTKKAAKGGGGRTSLQSTYPNTERTSFFNNHRDWDHIYIDNKGQGNLFMKKDGACTLYILCTIHPMFILGWRLNTRTRQNLAPDIRR